ncbi:MAG: hypothetical protein AAF743_08430 [Planctomycetota bacterium]
MRQPQRMRGMGLLAMFTILALAGVAALLAAQTTRLSFRMIQQSRDAQEATTALDQAVRQLADDVRSAEALTVTPTALSADDVTWTINPDTLTRGDRAFFTRLDTMRFEASPVGVRLILTDDQRITLPNAKRLRGGS